MSVDARRAGGLNWLVAPDLRHSLQRFPLPCALAALLAVVVILDQYEALLWGVSLQDRVIGGLVAAVLAALAVDLLAEGRGWGAGPRLALHAAAIAANAALHIAPLPWRVADELLIPGLLLSVSVAGHLRPQVSLDAFWRFNERLWLSAGFAVLGAAAFAIGIFVIDRSLDVLFGIDFEEIVTNVVFPLSFCLLAPLTWLSAIPRLDAAEELGPDDFLDRAVRLIARFILVPLLMTYAVILLAYALQILLTWSLPEGQIGWMVSAFGTAGSATVLLLYPERHTGGRLVRWFMRWWFALTVVPVILLVIALDVRLDAYGLTAPRYALSIAAAWLGAMAVLFAWPRTVERDIRLIPGMLALLLLVGSFGPWGATAAGVRSQIDEFLSLSRREGWMEGDRLQVAAIAAAMEQRRLDRQGPAERARSILDHIASQDGLAMLEDRLANPEALTELARSSLDLRRVLAEDLGLEPAGPEGRPRPVGVAEATVTRPIGGYDVLHGPIRLTAGAADETDGSLAGGRAVLQVPGGGSVALDLEPLVREAKPADGPDKDLVRLPAFLTARLHDGREVGVLILQVGGLWIEGRLELHMLQAVVLVPDGAAAGGD